MKTYLALVMVGLGLVGCGAQELQPAGGSHDAARPAIDATERNLDDAGCPPEGKIACPPYGCPGSDIIVAPVCVEGVWSCPVILIYGLTCPVDAAATTASDGGNAGTEDAGVTCSSGESFACGTCGSDTGLRPLCVGGAWSCPPGLVDVRTCPTTPPKCQGPDPFGCFCNPITGVVTCRQDAGADAPSD